MVLSIDRTINNIENTLTDISPYPVAGTLAGGAKILMGAVQTLTALACGILTVVPAAISKDWSPVKHSWTHIKHGLGNIVAGTIEALPLVQTVFFFVRQARQLNGSGLQIYLHTGHERKFMPYTSLVEVDFSIEGAVNRDVKAVRDKFKQKLGGVRNPTPKTRLKLAQDAVKGR